MKLLCDTFWQKYEAFIKKYVHFSRNKKQLALLVSNNDYLYSIKVFLSSSGSNVKHKVKTKKK